MPLVQVPLVQVPLVQVPLVQVPLVQVPLGVGGRLPCCRARVTAFPGKSGASARFTRHFVNVG
ncbi:hypothetical protein OHA72_41635 [Dactylosporangium sp. NBC_01737]|uniref:hypothetical protein n=1 Tax=Dactylosporangium sp. NBC_01737 TaxID=2975959 RepID=UPI002E1158DF|nr:hypothetical protein OHA72_41635 [Dactylosporangium sp. NBC_01737]